MAQPGGSAAVTTLREVRTALQHASGREKLDLILSAPEPRALVQALPSTELYLSILDIGLDDAAPIVALASPEQFRHFLDLGCWPKRDAPPDPRKLLRWITLAREGAGRSQTQLGHLREKLAGIDAELFSLLLRLEVTVHELDPNEPHPDVPGETWMSPDRRYLVELRGEGDDLLPVRTLLDDLAEQDHFLVSRALEALRWELPAELEEAARRWREGRLRDLGIPDFEEALGFVARPARKSAKEGAALAGPTPLAAAAPPAAAIAVRPAPARPLLERALELLEGVERDRAEEAVTYAANAALVAWSVPLDDLSQVRRVLEDARALLSLGLELSGGDDAPGASRALVERPVRELFQASMAELYRLQGRARQAAAALRLPQTKSASLLEGRHAQLVDALEETPPGLAGLAGLARTGASLRTADAVQAPGTRADLAAADGLLDEADALARLLPALGLPLDVVGQAAEAAGRRSTSLQTSDVLRAAARAELRGRPLSFAEETSTPGALEAALDRILARGLSSLAEPERAAAARIVSRLRDRILG